MVWKNPDSWNNPEWSGMKVFDPGSESVPKNLSWPEFSELGQKIPSWPEFSELTGIPEMHLRETR